MDATTHSASPSWFKIANQTLNVPIVPPCVMGILNVTPDSFSDGGRFMDPTAAVERALQQVSDGARIIDIGGESTRPGSRPVAPEEQIRRVVPVIEELRKRNPQIPISIDTTSAIVAQTALSEGACIVNDTSALRDDPKLAEVVASFDASIILMHRRGTPLDMQAGGGPDYADLTTEISQFLNDRIEFATACGIDREKIAVDPGIGFGKKWQDNFRIIRELHSFTQLGRPIVVGASRKGFIGQVLEINQPDQRMIGSVACALLAAAKGASIIRAHDVRETVEALNTLMQILQAN